MYEGLIFFSTFFGGLRITTGLNEVFSSEMGEAEATHLIEDGTDVHYVQRLLGHSSIQTTQSYLRVANGSLLKVKSPLD